MKVAKWYNNQDIRIEEEETPSPGPKEMVIKVMSCGICGSDIVEWYRLPRAPLVQGHEIGAEVVEVGTGVNSFRPGDRVFVAPKVPCMNCEYCASGHHPVCTNVLDRLPGGFAEYILVPEDLVEKGAYLLPQNVSYDQSTFIEPLACAIRAQRLANLNYRQTILVLGAGISGLIHIKLAKLKECEVFAADVSPARLEYAEKYGADCAFTSDEDLATKVRKTVDCVVVGTSSLVAIEQAWQMVDRGGAVVFFAVPSPDKNVSIPVNDFWRKEIRVLTSYYAGPTDIEKAVTLLAREKITVEEMITDRIPLDEIKMGFKKVMDGNYSLKVIIKPHAKLS